MALFSIFSTVPDHPLGARKQVRQVAADLARREPRQAVEESAAWLESLTSTEVFRLPDLLERVQLIENAGMPALRRLTRDYLAASAGSPAAATWDAAFRFCNQLAQAYRHVLERQRSGGRGNNLRREQLALTYAAALNAWAGVQKWQHFRYRRLPESFWEIAGKYYLAAGHARVEQLPLEVYAGYGQTSVEGEYLRVLLFHVAAMDTLAPLEIELGERLIAHFIKYFSLASEPLPGSVYWVDPTQARAPARMVRMPSPHVNLRFFSGAGAQKARDQLVARIEAEGAVPADVPLGGNYPADTVLRVLAHLGMAWSAKPPVRDHVRRPVQAPLAVIHGFAEAMRTIAYAASETRTRIPDLELWTVSDVSLGGMAIHGRLGHNPWPAIGVLVTMKPDGNGNWLLGVVRRFSRNPELDEATNDAVLVADPNFACLGIETLSKAPLAVLGDANGLQLDMILLDLPVVGECCRVVVPPNSVEATIPVSFALNGQNGRLMPREVQGNGPDYCIVSFMVQSFF